MRREALTLTGGPRAQSGDLSGIADDPAPAPQTEGARRRRLEDRRDRDEPGALGPAERRDLTERGGTGIVRRGRALGGFDRLGQLALRFHGAPLALRVKLDLELQVGRLAGSLAAGGLLTRHGSES